MTAESTQDTTMWQDRKRRLWLMGLIVPTLLLAMLPIVWAMNQFGWQAASQVLVLDRPDPAVHRAAGAGPAVRRRRPESARRSHGVAGERQVLPLLHVRVHPVPVPERGPGRLPVHRVEPELAGLRRGARAGRPRSVWRCRSEPSAASASTPRTRWGTRRSRWSAGCPRSRWRRPATATSTSSTTAATTSGSRHRKTPRRPASARRSGSSCRAACSAACGRPGGWRPSAYAGRARNPWNPKTYLSNDVLNAWAMSAVLCGALIAVFGPGADPVPGHLGGLRLHPARIGQLPRALRPAAGQEAPAAATSGAPPSTAGTPTTS